MSSVYRNDIHVQDMSVSLGLQHGHLLHSKLAAFMILPLHGFNYYQLAHAIGLGHTVFMQQEVSVTSLYMQWLCLLIEAGLCNLSPIPCSPFHFDLIQPGFYTDKLTCSPVFKPPAFKSPFSFHLGCGQPGKKTTTNLQKSRCSGLGQNHRSLILEYPVLWSSGCWVGSWSMHKVPLLWFNPMQLKAKNEAQLFGERG